ncbi:deoxyribose-phosphate aldolase [Halalkaliarchaeum sp. AArc-GB]|uniref:deoxyribose-phosphate aldolase n=1 Tax=Halalkaliarchaeum sp. AArc-GB TaxID=3074078 RepID=UPI00285EECA8|nr:deoxyribose-phosphate aldolase [Halalkaliarchaeum sp. AArc-GB]MDR5674146.1 deoxyribose-phosphate aldolase [Halalkaliarchaeum sp. AArc-GB]
MNRTELAAKIDHTVLGPTTTDDDVEHLLAEAEEYGMNACIPPCYVPEAETAAPSVTLATVIGFPHGHHATDVKREEAVRAWQDGADELDLVANVGRLKSGDLETVENDIAEVVAAVPIPVKVIIEAPLLTDEEKHRAAEAVRDADAAMVKTATGFADGGATLADVELLSEYLPVKASGGIGTYDLALEMLEAGADRIGASSGVEIVTGAPGE